MWSAKTRSYVRTWHHKAFEDYTGRPLLIVSYRFALDKFVRFTNYTPVHYDAWSRQRIRSMTMNNRCLSIVLKQEPVLVKQNGDQTFAKKPRLVFFEPRRIQQGLLVLTVGLAFRLDPTPAKKKKMTKEEWKKERKISKKEEEEDDDKARGNDDDDEDDDDICFGFRGHLDPWVDKVTVPEHPFLVMGMDCCDPGDFELVVLFSKRAVENNDDVDSDFLF